MRIFINDRPVNCTAQEAEAIEKLKEAKGFAGIQGYTPDPKKFENNPQYNISVNVGISIAKLYDDKNKALKDIKFNDLDLSDWIESKGRDAFATAKEQFKHCIDKLIANTDNDRDRSMEAITKNAHKLAHLMNYIPLQKEDGKTQSVKVHLQTEKNEEGHMRPVLDVDGIPTVKSILVPYRGTGVKTHITKGIYKKVNSGSKKLMDNAIEKLLPANTKMGQCSLKPGNFTSIKVVKQEIYEAELHTQETKKLETLKA